MKTITRLSIVGALSVLALQVKAEPEFPKLSLTLAPHMIQGQVDNLAVTLTLQSPSVAAGETLLTMPVVLVSTPTAAYHAEKIQASDAIGELTLHEEALPADPSGQYRRYFAERATEGALTYQYHTPPRAVDISTRNGPLFDLRQQQAGIMGAGVYFLALPEGPRPYQVNLHWDMSQMEPGSKGVWSRGEGDQTLIAPAELLRFSYYAAGKLNQWPTDSSRFTMFWLDKPPFDMSQLAPQTQKLYDYMAAFFDDESDYRVFARANPYPAGGGTGLAHSFMFGYGSEGQTIAEGVQILLAHEMAHTWPTLNGSEAHAETAWYTEGTAEYYAILMSLRSGVIDVNEFINQINLRASAYYANPYINLNNHDAGELFWKDARAQKVPYGRGFMYMFNLNQQLLAYSKGKRSLDNLVKEIYKRQEQGEQIGLAQWKEMLKRELGDNAATAFDAMTQGATQPAVTSAFGCLAAKAVRYRPFDLGFDEMRLGEVNRLRVDSEAARAGLKDGDEIVSATPLEQLRADDQKQMDITVLRDGKSLSFHFLPRGPEVDGWQWQLNALGVAACRF